MSDNINVQFKRGTLDLILLSLIEKHGCNYGYVILEKMAEIGGQFFDNPKPGTVYPVLYRLEKDGFISVSGSDSKGGPARKLYSVTAEGKKKLKADIASWRDYNLVVEKFIGKK